MPCSHIYRLVFGLMFVNETVIIVKPDMRSQLAVGEHLVYEVSVNVCMYVCMYFLSFRTHVSKLLFEA